jgi:hypothetical protein
MHTISLALDLQFPDDITVMASEDGRTLAFRDAVLARAEVNKNSDEISPEGIEELARTIHGRPIDVEHLEDQNCGVFTSGRAVDGALYVDGIIWADRYPKESQGVRNGTHHLSIEAVADKATCSACGRDFGSTGEYCEHLLSRKAHKATRRLRGLTATGGGVTTNPAGTNTMFDTGAIRMVASHAEPVLESDNPPPPVLQATQVSKENAMNEEQFKAALEAMQAKLDASTTATAALQASFDEFKKEKEAEAVSWSSKVADVTAQLAAMKAEKEAEAVSWSSAVASLRASLVEAVTGAKPAEETTKIYASMNPDAFGLLLETARSAQKAPAGAVGIRLAAAQNDSGHNTPEPLTL